MEIDNLALLAGGMATRLKPVSEKIPKSLIEVAGKPFIYHQIELLREKGINRILICAGVMGEQIRNYTGNGKELNVEIDFSFDGDIQLGTGGAIKNALELLPENFFVMYGDSYLNTDFKIINEYFLQQKKSGLMTVYENKNKWDSSNVEFESGKILCYDKKNKTESMNYIDYGLGILSHKAFEDFENEKAFDLEKVYRNLLNKNELSGFEVKERFYEIGSFNGLEETNEFLSKNKMK